MKIIFILYILAIIVSCGGGGNQKTEVVTDKQIIANTIGAENYCAIFFDPVLFDEADPLRINEYKLEWSENSNLENAETVAIKRVSVRENYYLHKNLTNNISYYYRISVNGNHGGDYHDSQILECTPSSIKGSKVLNSFHSGRYHILDDDGRIWWWGALHLGSNRSFPTPICEKYYQSTKFLVCQSWAKNLADIYYGYIIKADGTLWIVTKTGLEPVCSPGVENKCDFDTSHGFKKSENFLISKNGEVYNGSPLVTKPIKLCRINEETACLEYWSGVKKYFDGLVLLEDGTVWSWGDNQWGQLGNGSADSSLTPQRVCANVVENQCIDYLEDIKDIYKYQKYAFAISNSGENFTWGALDAGLGVTMNETCNQTPCLLFAKKFHGLSDIKYFSGKFALSNSGNVWTWSNKSAIKQLNELPQIKSTYFGVALDFNNDVWVRNGSNYGFYESYGTGEVEVNYTLKLVDTALNAHQFARNNSKGLYFLDSESRINIIDLSKLNKPNSYVPNKLIGFKVIGHNIFVNATGSLWRIRNTTRNEIFLSPLCSGLQKYSKCDHQITNMTVATNGNMFLSSEGEVFVRGDFYKFGVFRKNNG